MELIRKIIQIVCNEAETLRTNAAYSGSWGDNGASRMEDQVKFYEYGLQGIIPPEWQAYKEIAEKQIKIEENPDKYKQFQELQKFFEERSN